MKIRLLICLFLFISFHGYSQCTLNVTISKSGQAICSGNAVTLTASVSGGTGPFTYSWSNGGTGASINVKQAATYKVTVLNASGCSGSQSITIATSTTPNAPTAKNQTVCQNTPATLKVTSPVQGATYQWYASDGTTFLQSGDTYVTNSITAATTFYVQVTIDGCTSAQTAVNVALYGKPTVTSIPVCAGNVATLTVNSGDSFSWYDSPTSTNVLSTEQSFTTPPLTASKTYYVVVINNGCPSARTPVIATVTPPPAPPTVTRPSPICSGSSITLHADAPVGVIDWFSAPSGGTSLISSPDYTTSSLTANTTFYVQTSINDCVSTRIPVTVVVNSPPEPPTAQNVSTCYNTAITLTATTTPSGIYNWYSVPSGGTAIATNSNTYTTPALKSSTTFYVQAVNGACSSARVPIIVTVKPLLAVPTVNGAVVCSGSSASLTATSPGGTYKWYAAATGGTALATTTTDPFNTPALTITTTYYVECTFEGCKSPREPVTVTVVAAPAAPTAADKSVCSGSATALIANSPSNVYAWYDSPNGGTLLSSGKVFVTPALTANTTYYVETTNANDCPSPRKAVTVTIVAPPSPPTVKNTSICTGTSATLIATGTGALQAQWYTDPSGGTAIFTGNTFNTPALTITKTYYVQVSTATCSSGRIPVTVSITPTYSPEFQYSSGTYCTSGPNQRPVVNNPTGGNFSASPAGLVFVSTTTGEINVAASTPGAYVVAFTSNAPCPTTTVAKLYIVSTPDATFSYGGPYCQDGANPFPTFGPIGTPGTFSATPSGLVFLNSSTGEIDLGKSSPGDYTITNTIVANGVCPLVAYKYPSLVSIKAQVNVNAGPDQTVPTGTVVQLAGSITGGITTGKWSGGTGTFSNSSDQAATYTPGTGEKTVTLTLTSDDPPGVCGPKSSKVIISFIPAPAAPVVQVSPVCAGNNAILSATAPGGNYEWFDVATGGTPLNTTSGAASSSYTTDPLTVNKTYYVQTTVKGVTSARVPVTVTVNPVPVAPSVTGSQTVCIGSVTTLTASGGLPGSIYNWHDAPVGGKLISNQNPYITAALNTNTSYYVSTKTNGCEGPRAKFDLTVTPTPNITSALTGSVCSSNALSYTITADQPGTTFTWSRAAVPGISNPAAPSQTSSTIDETLINTTNGTVNVTYVIVPTLGTCAGPPFNYTVTVYSQPVVISTQPGPICNQTAPNYAIKFNVTPSFTWSRAVVPGISNAAVSNQAASIIREVLFNTTNAPVDVTYVFNYKSGTCGASTYNLVVTVNPTAIVTNPVEIGIACSDVPQTYALTSNVANPTFVWNRTTSADNSAVGDQTGPVINETLKNTGTNTVSIIYTITPYANGCPGTPFKHTVSVTPEQAKPQPTNTGPFCEGGTIQLFTQAVPNATYLWTAPDGETFTDQNPVINNITVKKYAGPWQVVTMLKGLCSSAVGTTVVNIDAQPTATATHGPNPLLICGENNFIQLDGSIDPSNTGHWLPSETGGTFDNINDPKTIYHFSAEDKLNKIVILTLVTATKSLCPPSSSTFEIDFGLIPAVNAGPDLTVCAQDKKVKMFGRNFVPSTRILWEPVDGTGSFDAPNQLDANYIPSTDDIKKGSVQLKLTNLDAGPCYTLSDIVVVNFSPPPTLYAGGVRYVLRGNTITLNPTVSDEDVTYKWSPNIDISDVNIKNPVVTGDINRFYTLTVTDKLGCVSTDNALVVVSPEIKINNTFTPNGDGVNDLWEITGLIAYTNATVDIFNRYGQKLFHSVGYPKAWDGTYNGQPVPAGVYYYIIDTKVNNQVLSGYVTIIR